MKRLREWLVMSLCTIIGGFIAFFVWLSFPFIQQHNKENDLIEKRAQEIYIEYKAQCLVEDRLNDETR